MIDGAIVIIDLALGIEKCFVEKHPAAITALAFFEEKILMSGSVDGRVNLCDLDSEGQKKVYKCQNVMDHKIPIVSVTTADFGIGCAIDIEGNCRFYDFYRLRKLAKISAKANTSLNQPGGAFRLLPAPVVCATPEAFLGMVQSDETEPITMPDPPVFV